MTDPRAATSAGGTGGSPTRRGRRSDSSINKPRDRHQALKALEPGPEEDFSGRYKRILLKRHG